jgi:hypothetical protein
MLISDEIVAGLSKAERAIVAQRMAKIERALDRRGKIASWLLWLLEEPRIQQRIRDIANG